MTNKDKSASTLWRTAAIELGLRSEQVGDRIRARFEQFSPSTDAPQIHAYRGYGANQQFTISGRVLRNKPTVSTENSSVWSNLKRSYLMFETDELANANVSMEIGSLTFKTKTDEEGYFKFENIQVPSTVFDIEQHNCTLFLTDYSEEPNNTVGKIHWINDEAEFGVISDIDDTIMHTQATSLLKMMKTTLLESPATRFAFPGISDLYNALHRQINPVFYVSSSPWNLYTFLEEFMSINGLVSGPMFLRDFGIDKEKFIAGSHGNHKRIAIETILQASGSLPFILIGDSGQHDPEIYAQVAKTYPDRVKAIYIRDVSNDLRDAEVQSLHEELAELNIELVLASNSSFILDHAQSSGFLGTKDKNTKIPEHS